MRFTSSTTELFYNLRLLNAQDSPASAKKAGAEAPASKSLIPVVPCYSFWLKKSKYRSVNRAVSAAAM